MKDIQFPNQNRNNNFQPKIMPVEQARKFTPPNSNRDYYTPPKKNGNKYLALGLFFSLLVISVVFFLASFVFDGATITIKPLKKELSINETYIISPEERKDLLKVEKISEVSDITIPKKIVKKVNRKAEGTVTIYNNYSSESQKFVKGTRLTTTDGKIFKITENVTVPPKNGTKMGEISVKVIADMEGLEYNIGPTTFTIPGLKASPKYKGFYAESTTSMKGGASGNVNEVSDADLSKAKEEIKTKVIDELVKKANNEVPENFTFNKDMLLASIGKMEKINEDNETATYNISATGTVAYFKRDEIVKKIIDSQNLNNNIKPIVKVLDTKDFVVSLLDSQELLKEDSGVRMVLTGTAPVVFYPNKQAIIEYYAGRSVKDFDNITKQFQFIDSASRVIRPLWNTTFPSSIAKIELNFEE